MKKILIFFSFSLFLNFVSPFAYSNEFRTTPAHLLDFSKKSVYPKNLQNIPTLFACNYEIKNLKCISLNSNILINQATERQLSIYSNQDTCKKSCEDLIPLNKTAEEIEFESKIIINNIPRLYRTLREEEISTLLKKRNIRRSPFNPISVLQWVGHGLGKNLKQYISFSAKQESFQNEKYFKTHSNSLDLSVKTKAFVELDMKGLFGWAKRTGKTVRLPTRKDLKILDKKSSSKLKFPNFALSLFGNNFSVRNPLLHDFHEIEGGEVNELGSVVLIIPIAYPEWQDFFFPGKFVYSDNSVKQSVYSAKIRQFSIKDLEVLVVADELPISLFEVNNLSDQEFIEKFEKVKGFKSTSVKKKKIILPPVKSNKIPRKAALKIELSTKNLGKRKRVGSVEEKNNLWNKAVLDPDFDSEKEYKLPEVSRSEVRSKEKEIFLDQSEL